MIMKKVAMAVAFLMVGVGGYELGRWRTDDNAQRMSVARNAKPAAGVIEEKSKAGLAAATAKGGALVAAASAVDRGFAAAELNIDEALRLIETLPASERSGFVAGIFSFVARNVPPAEGLKLSQRLPAELRQSAWRTLVGEWIYSRSPMDEEKRAQMRDAAFTSNGGRQGLLVELSGLLASSKPDPEMLSAWLDSFSDGTARSEMLASLVSAFPREDVEALFKRTQGWTAWEQERVQRRFLSNWAYENPQEAWSWFQNQRGEMSGDLASSVFMAWANKDPDGAQKLLEAKLEPGQRDTLLNVIGRTLAMKNTDAAVAWADGLADARERGIAHQGIYDGAPRGVGAVLDFNDGFPTLRGVVPGSPLDGSGVKPGDRLVEVREANGAREPLYGADMQTAVNLIRGEPGSQMTLRILRKNGESGVLEEHLIPVTRAQLYLDEKRIPKAQ
jgi:hypothetical protein